MREATVSDSRRLVGDKAPKTALETLSSWGGLIALIISLITGGFTALKELWLEPAQKNVDSFRADIQQIASINAESASKMAQTTDDAAKGQISVAATTSKWFYVQPAVALLPKIKGRASTQDYSLLGQEEVTNGHYTEAIGLYNDALKGAAGMDRAGLLRGLVGAEINEDPTKYGQLAKQQLDEAYQLASQSTAYASKLVAVEIKMDRRLVENITGNCLVPAMDKEIGELSGKLPIPQQLNAQQYSLQELSRVAEYCDSPRGVPSAPSSSQLVDLKTDASSTAAPTTDQQESIESHISCDATRPNRIRFYISPQKTNVSASNLPTLQDRLGCDFDVRMGTSTHEPNQAADVLAVKGPAMRYSYERDILKVLNREGIYVRALCRSTLSEQPANSVVLTSSKKLAGDFAPLDSRTRSKLSRANSMEDFNSIMQGHHCFVH